MKITYQYLEEGHYLFVKWEGDFVLNDYLKSIEILTTKAYWNEKIRMLMDIRQLTLEKEANMGIKTIKSIKQVNQVEKFPPFRLAYLVFEPKIIASLHLYIEEEKKTYHSIFSTVSAAKTYLKLEMSNQEIENQLRNLKEELI